MAYPECCNCDGCDYCTYGHIYLNPEEYQEWINHNHPPKEEENS